MQDTICVIIPARGAVETLGRCVRSVLDTAYLRLEVIVADDGLDESGIAQLAEFRDRVKVIGIDGRGPSYARNRAAESTSAAYVAFTDSDCIVDRQWLNELLKGFVMRPEAAACGGRQEIPRDASEFEKRLFSFMETTGFVTDYVRQAGGDARIVTVDHNASCNVMYRRDIFVKEGGLLEGLWPGEDVEFDYRLKKKGYVAVFNPGAVVYHYRPKDIQVFAGMMYRYGAAQALLVKRYGFFRKIHFVPVVSAAVLVLLVSLSAGSGTLWFLGLIMVLCGAVTVIMMMLGEAALGVDLIRMALVTYLFWHFGFMRGLISRGLGR